MAEKHVPYWMWAFTISFILITFLPRSLDNTMFMDGVAYASIARNMAQGIGSFWKPYFADSFWLPYDNDAFFYGHPPLQFGIVSLLYRIFGDSPLVENLYNLIVLLLSVGLITSIWKQFFKDQDSMQRYGWLPVLCWYSMLIVWYAIPNHMLDSTMTLFCLLSCYFQLKAVGTQNTQAKYTYSVLGAFSIYLGFLSKGPVALYPLAFTAIYLLSFHRAPVREAIQPTILLVAGFAVCILLTLCFEPARFFLSKYFKGQVIGALMHQREAVSNDWTAHFYLIKELFRSIMPHILMSVALVLIFFIFKIKISISHTANKVFRTCLIIALSAFLPLLISVKQYHHYLLPSMPFFALAFAAFLQNKVSYILNFNRSLSITGVCFGILSCWSITYHKFKSTQPDYNVANALTIKRYVPDRATIGICPALYQKADLHVSLQRYDHLSLTTRTDTTIFTLADSSCMESFGDAEYGKIRLQAGYYLLMKRSDSQKLNRIESLSHL